MTKLPENAWYTRFYLISNGNVNEPVPMMLIEYGSGYATPEEACDLFAAQTGTPRDEVVCNPVGDPIDPSKIS